ncbi:MAG TPA: SAM-dependent methyltransferase, partial [Candidatus Hydrogenedentes bacterium]|nr:SAM-dependent methyltransferase [Candidatus Hydrogenedentota bacterium]
MTTSTERFGDRAMQYARFRPGYPLGLVALLEKEGLLQQGAVVADIGSGTGKLSEVFLERGYG